MNDISKRDSFKGIKGQINDINEKIDISKIAIIVVGNKCDLPDDKKQVDEQDKNFFEKQFNIKIIEASAKSNINVNECFIALIDKMLSLGLGRIKQNDDDEFEKRINLPLRRMNSNCFGSGKKNLYVYEY